MSKRRNGDRSTNVVDQMWSSFSNNPSRNRKFLYEEMYLRVLTEICANRFKWNGLPPEIDKRFLELQLFRQALCVFFNDTKEIALANGDSRGGFEKYFALRGSGAGRWNMYDNPVTFRVVGNQMLSRTLIAPDQCVPIWGNTLRSPDLDIVFLQSSKLAEIERTIEINLIAMRKPWLLAVDDNQRQTVVNLFRQVAEGQPVIFGTQSLGQNIEDIVKLLDLKIDKDLVLNLQIAKSKIWNETMGLIGINNANQDKKERLVSDEVSANDDQIAAVRNSAMTARMFACEQINSKYNLNVSVEWNETTPLLESVSLDNELNDDEAPEA